MNLAKAGTLEQAERAARESLDLRSSVGDVAGRAHSTRVLAHVMIRGNRGEEAYRHAGEALRLAERAADPIARVRALATMSLSAPTSREAIELGELAIAAYREAGNLRELAGVQSSLAYHALVLGDDDLAETMSTVAVDTARADGDPLMVALTHGNAGLALLFNGRIHSAQQAFLDELRLVAASGFQGAYAAMLFEAVHGLAAVAAADGDDRVAATLCGVAEALSQERHDPILERRLDEHFLNRARARLGTQDWDAARAAGRDLDRERAIDTAVRSTRTSATS